MQYQHKKGFKETESYFEDSYTSRVMRKPFFFAYAKNKGTDQMRSNCAADQCLCFHYIDSTIPLLSKSKISSLYPPSVAVQRGLCMT